jgi:hypothetical protein
MNRDQFAHAIRASCAIIDQQEVLIIGSQTILGTWDDTELPHEVVRSQEVDICPLNDDDAGSLATALDGAIGEGSPFHEQFKFYVQGVGRRTASLPNGWEQRLVVYSNESTMGYAGLCLEPHDACAAKIAAFRENDQDYVRALVKSGLIDPDLLLDRLRTVKIDPERLKYSIQFVEAISQYSPLRRTRKTGTGWPGTMPI